MIKILIIDDDPAVRAALKVRLEKEDYAVVCAKSGYRGLELAASEQPNLIVLDLAIPDLDGLDVLDRLQNSVVTWEIPVMVVTAKGDLSDRDKALGRGAKSFFHKPLSTPDLVRKIGDVLRSSFSA